MDTQRDRKRLSKNLLQMKFMKRTKEKHEKELENEEGHKLFKHEMTDAMRIQGNRFTVEPSYAIIENLTFGRLAYRGMNPEIERMMEDARLKEQEAEASKREVEVNDQEMAEFYSQNSLNRTVGRKFASKRSANGVSQKYGDESSLRSTSFKSDVEKGQSSSKKRKFMKPKDD